MALTYKLGDKLVAVLQGKPMQEKPVFILTYYYDRMLKNGSNCKIGYEFGDVSKVLDRAERHMSRFPDIVKVRVVYKDPEVDGGRLQEITEFERNPNIQSLPLIQG